MDELGHRHPYGVFLRREALELGYSDRDLVRARTARTIERVRHGAYVDASVWGSADDTVRHKIRCHAVSLSHGPSVSFSHLSAAVLLGVDTWGVDLDPVHVIKDGERSGRRHGDVVYHEAALPQRERMYVDGVPIVSPAHAVLGAASLATVEAGVVIVDSAYHRKLLTPEDLRYAYDEIQGWPGTARLQMTLRIAAVGSESVGESRARFLFWSCHLPRPLMQYEVRDARGHLIGISDFAWPHLGILGEFDGRAKYGRLLKPGQEPADAVYAEKRREDRMREVTGWRFFRLGWDDLAMPQRTARRFHDLVRSSSPVLSR